MFPEVIGAGIIVLTVFKNVFNEVNSGKYEYKNQHSGYGGTFYE